MKAISATLVIIVTAIVILVAALVVLTIFGGGVQPVVDITSQKSLCTSQYTTICSASGSEPPTWNVKMKVTVGGEIKSCSCDDLVACTGCSDRKPICMDKPPNC